MNRQEQERKGGRDTGRERNEGERARTRWKKKKKETSAASSGDRYHGVKRAAAEAEAEAARRVEHQINNVLISTQKTSTHLATCA